VRELIDFLDFSCINILKITAIASTVLASNMSNARNIQRSRMQNKDLFCKSDWRNLPENQLDLCERTYIRFEQKIFHWYWNEGLDIHDSPVLPVVHGTSSNKAWVIAEGGFASLSQTDDGYYGKGMYFTTCANYTIDYFPEKEVAAIIICLLIPGNPYPVIEHPRESDAIRAKAIRLGYQSHYVTVNKSGVPLTMEDYLTNKDRYDEIVIDQEAQVAPIFILEVSENKEKNNNAKDNEPIQRFSEVKIRDRNEEEEILIEDDNNESSENRPSRRRISDSAETKSKRRGNKDSSSDESEMQNIRKDSLKSKLFPPRKTSIKENDGDGEYKAWSQ